MTPERATSAPDAIPRIPRRSGLILLGICAAFAVFRLPLMYRQYGAQDEEWYAVPGYTIVHTGIPQIPFAPARDLNSVFYRADEALFALPPAYFYWQALFYTVCEPGYFTGRLASGAAGLAAILLVYQIGRRFYRDEAIALGGAALYSISRVFFFPATVARPDIACAAIGFAALLAVWRWRTTSRMQWLFAGGALAGLGMLTHPFAIVYCVQLGIWVLIGGGLRRGLWQASLFTGAALLVFAAWLPLILSHPEAFRVQFVNNILRPAGPGLFQRFVFPYESFTVQYPLFVDRAGPLQAALFALGLVAATVMDWRTAQRGRVTILALVWSSVYLLVACLGDHPTKEYWCYPGGLLCLCVASVSAAAVRRVARGVRRPTPLAWVAVLVFAAVMAPGSGIRTWLAHLQHWSRVDYCSPRFVHQMLQELPADGRFLVDRAYVFDFYVAGRETLLANDTQAFFRAKRSSYNYLIAGPCVLQYGVPDDMGAEYLRAFGDRRDLFACFAEVYVVKAD